MRFYLDTNIMVFLWTGETENICRDVLEQICDYSNTLLVSSVCVVEFTHLLHIGKVRRRHGKDKAVVDVVEWCNEMGIDIVHTTDAHIRQFKALPIHTDAHRDPFDRFIIAQAIADRIPLISSDHKFFIYESDGLSFVFNER